MRSAFVTNAGRRRAAVRCRRLRRDLSEESHALEQTPAPPHYSGATHHRRKLMSFLDVRRFGSVDAARRTFLGVSGLGLSGAAVALLAGRDSLAAAAEASANPANDVAILNTALAADSTGCYCLELG